MTSQKTVIIIPIRCFNHGSWSHYYISTISLIKVWFFCVKSNDHLMMKPLYMYIHIKILYNIYYIIYNNTKIVWGTLMHRQLYHDLHVNKMKTKLFFFFLKRQIWLIFIYVSIESHKCKGKTRQSARWVVIPQCTNSCYSRHISDKKV